MIEQLDFFETLEKPTLVCPACEKIFEKKINHQKYCSIKCKSKEYRKINIERIKLLKKEYYQKNKEYIKAKSHIYKKNNKEKGKIYTDSRKEIKRIYDIEYRKKTREFKLVKDRIYYHNNKKNILQKCKVYRNKNKDKINERSRKRYQNDFNYKISNILRKRLSAVLKIKNTPKIKKTLELLGCSIQEFKNYLEKQFKEGMTWENRGLYGWHIDHIIPCASFDLSDPEQQKKCFHYTNLQPLWWNENLSKGSKILN
jgi:hypothetical protein